MTRTGTVMNQISANEDHRHRSREASKYGLRARLSGEPVMRWTFSTMLGKTVALWYPRWRCCWRLGVGLVRAESWKAAMLLAADMGEG